MPSKPFFDFSRIDLQKVEIPIEKIREINPQRFEFEQLDGIFKIIPEEGIIVGYKDIRSDEFWVRGHIPGNPLYPGALMIEAAAQLCSYYQGNAYPLGGFFGFGGVDGVKFRSAVKPGDRLILIGKAVVVTHRLSTFNVQGICGEKLVFEATITGVRISLDKRMG